LYSSWILSQFPTALFCFTRSNSGARFGGKFVDTFVKEGLRLWSGDKRIPLLLLKRLRNELGNLPLNLI